MQRILRKCLGSLALVALLAGCTNYSVVNVPHISNNYRYVTLQADDYDLYSDLRDQLAVQDIEVITNKTSKAKLLDIVRKVSVNKKVLPVDEVRYRPAGFEGSNSLNPLEITSIDQCVDNHLNLACIQNFIPNIFINSYAQDSKTLSRLEDGSTGQIIYIANATGTISVPTLGSVSLLDIQSDTQLNDETQPLAQVRTAKQNTILLKRTIAESIVNKIVFILEDQTIREYNRK
ncbi:hypothetical protein CKF54_00675 [Psittacicella hinzii]|uniref:Lipoprotein n=1 Tax=Psittacicella hinzii TaxID=2028575 RepID=A0A3A1YAP1_9GAMM|nr:hypothetical protein [Psittacicella hinzii]RIY34406.1 hypothetical protein CKF54_00675 [Psittacicella hinzii]